jgi:hypothetical protein
VQVSGSEALADLLAASCPNHCATRIPHVSGPERQPSSGNYAPTAPNGSAKLRTYSSSSTTPRAKECKRMREELVAS